MRLSDTICAGMAGAVLLILLVGAAVSAATPDEFAAVRAEAIAAARDVQQKERAVVAVQDEIRLLGLDAEARRRGLAETREEQARLLGTIARVARHPPERRAVFPGAPIDQLHSELLMQAALPALRTQAQALTGEIARIAALRQQITARRQELDAARAALAGERERLARLVARRLHLREQMVRENPGAEARIARLAGDAGDLTELLKSAEAAADNHDKELLAQTRAGQRGTSGAAAAAEHVDPTRPDEPRTFDPAQFALVMPVSGTTTGRFGEADGDGAASEGVIVSALPGAAVVAPFDGRLVYAGPFPDHGLILIFRHGNLYNTLLAGLGRVDIELDQWVVAGEPVGVMPDVPAPGGLPSAEEDEAPAFGGRFYFALHRDGRPVDPQPWLAGGDEGHDERNEDQKVRQ